MSMWKIDWKKVFGNRLGLSFGFYKGQDMIHYDDYFGGLTREEYEKETEEHFKFIDHICKCDYDKAFALIDRYKDNLFATEFVSDEEAEMLYHTILNWKEKSEMYDDLCD